MSGITRIDIDSQVAKIGRFAQSRKYWSKAENLYQLIFANINPLIDDKIEYLEVKIEEHEAGYDRFLGIDVILTHQTEMSSTIQEKILFTDWGTVTVEYYNKPGSREAGGDWFDLRTDYYFVAYGKVRINSDKTEYLFFKEWILLNWVKIKEATGQGRIKWLDKNNTRSPAQASFRYIFIKDIPQDCIVAKSDIMIKDIVGDYDLPLPTHPLYNTSDNLKIILGEDRND